MKLKEGSEENQVVSGRGYAPTLMIESSETTEAIVALGCTFSMCSMGMLSKNIKKNTILGSNF